MKKVIAIIGPTGVGKTRLSIELAKNFNTEIISGDSIQVYRQLTIGSAKVTEEEKDGIPHHLINILDITDNYSVYDFQKQGRKIIDDLSSVGKIPIICGGTGLYIKSLLYDYEFKEEKEFDLSVYDKYTNEELYERLKQVDPKSCEKIHVNNRRRVIRCLSIYDNSSIRKSDIIDSQQHKLLYDVFLIGLTCDRNIVYDRINKRVDIMMENGLLSEIESLLNYENLFSLQGLRGIGYKEFEPYFKGELSLEACVEDVKKHSRQFAKRQYTWFNNQMDVRWYNIQEENYMDVLWNDLEKWLGE